MAMDSKSERNDLEDRYQFDGGLSLIVYREKCTGCRICELACSYHFGRCFSRKSNSLRVKRNEEKGEFVPVIYQESIGKRKACDLCDREEQEPFCVKNCPVGAIALIASGDAL